MRKHTESEKLKAARERLSTAYNRFNSAEAEYASAAIYEVNAAEEYMSAVLREEKKCGTYTGSPDLLVLL